MSRSSFVGRALSLSLAFLLLFASGTEGQTPVRHGFGTGMHTGFGYTAVIPDVKAGVGAWHLLGAGRIGVFADVKMSWPRVQDDGDYCPDVIASCTVPDIEVQRIDLKLKDADEYLIVNVGGIFAPEPEYAFLLGLGPVRHSRYREYYDGSVDTDILITQDGSYWAPYDPTSEWTVQFVAGVLIRLGNAVVLRFGYERAPGGISFGGYWVLGR